MIRWPSWTLRWRRIGSLEAERKSLLAEAEVMMQEFDKEMSDVFSSGFFRRNPTVAPKKPKSPPPFVTVADCGHCFEDVNQTGDC